MVCEESERRDRHCRQKYTSTAPTVRALVSNIRAMPLRCHLLNQLRIRLPERTTVCPPLRRHLSRGYAKSHPPKFVSSPSTLTAPGLERVNRGIEPAYLFTLDVRPRILSQQSGLSSLADDQTRIGVRRVTPSATAWAWPGRGAGATESGRAGRGTKPGFT